MEKNKFGNKAIIRKISNKENPYILINRIVLQDKRLSASSKAIMCLLISFPPCHNPMSIENIGAHFSDNMKIIEASVNELVCLGYLNRTENGVSL